MLDSGTRYQIALLQSNLLRWRLLQAQGLFERKEDWRDVAVTRDEGGKFASKGIRTPSNQGSSSESIRSSLSNLFGLPNTSKSDRSTNTDSSPQKLFDNIKDGIERLKTAKAPAQAQEIADQIVANAVPASIYLARTVAPDLLIGLSLGESLPVVLGGAAVFAAVGLATDKALKELDIDNPWIKAAANIATALIVSDVIRGVNAATTWNKFADSGVFPVVKAGKTADDLKATFKTVQQQLENAAKPAKSLLEQQNRDRFLHSLSLAAEANIEKPIGGFLADTVNYASGFIKTQDENLARYVEKELSGLKPALQEAEIDVEVLASRLARMCDMSDIPLLLRSKRANDVKNLVKRAKELPKALEDAVSPEITKIEKTLEDLSNEFGRRILDGEAPEVVIKDPKWMDSMLLVDKGNALEQGANWRSMLLNTEIKHGDQLDAFVYGKKNLRDRYEAFLGSLVKDKSSKAKISMATDEQFLKIKPENLLPGEIPMWEPWAPKKVRDWVAKESKKAVELFAKISPASVDISVGSFGSRAFHSKGIINVADGDLTVVWHELTHDLEQSVSDAFHLSSAFRGARTLKDGFDDMARLGIPGEKAVFDSFVNPYCGKVYLANSTEILTTAVEHLASGFGLHSLAVLDREHLMFAVSMLNHG
jgi:hypothetical protein